MRNDDPAALLAGLRHALATTRELDAAARAEARGVLGELARLGVGPAAEAPTPHGLEALAVRFEGEHPAIAATLRQASVLLGNAGI
jgi:hypothetical protein